jgi:serine/threonine-protein kinase HipA
MVTVAEIKIWDKLVGAVAWNAETKLGYLEFDASFAEHGWDLSPIKMPLKINTKQVFSFPELRGTNTFKGLPGLLADLLPDKYGNALINTWLARHARPANSLNPIEMLCFIGKRGMGALEIEPALPKSEKKASEIEIDRVIEIAEKILTGRKNFISNVSGEDEKALIDILKIGTSAGGARAKAVIAYNPKTKEVRSGQTNTPAGFSHWIIKFDGVTDSQFGASRGYGRVEMAYHKMAVNAGIEMMECQLLEENDRAHFMTKRFDRLPGNEKLHYQSFCAMQHYDFNDINLYSYEQLFETMRLLRLPYPEASQLFRRMVFNVMAKNCDDHTKNFAFLMDKTGTWKLSPAFDVCHAFRPGSEWVSHHALSINGKRNDIIKQDLMEVAYQMNIKKPKVIIEQVADSVNEWSNFADKFNVDTKLKKAISKTLHVIK